MRKLILLRGAPGTGKSTFVSKAGLEAFTLSADTMRLMLGGLVLNPSGKIGIDRSMNERTHTAVRSFGMERMNRGETLVIDATHAAIGDMTPWFEAAAEHRYRTLVVDFSTFPHELAIEQDANRPEWKRVGEGPIKRMYALIEENPTRPQAGVDIVHWAADGSHVRRTMDWLREPTFDLSGYEAVVHFGDLQGCHTVLVEGPLRQGFRNDTAYVFIGDLLDRGIENGKLMRWFLDEALPRDNVFLLWGNHEDHLHIWARGREAVSNEFKLRTLPQLLREGITAKDADAVCEKAREFLAYTYRGQSVLATHAGLSTMPARPELISLHQFSHGTGYWEDPVDEQFERNTDPDSPWVQVHGHRNHGAVAIHATRRSFNLEDSVETGGCLRVATLDASGWKTRAYRNPVYNSLRDRLGLETNITPQRAKARKMIPHWMFGERTSLSIDSETLSAMIAHKGVRDPKTSATAPHVAALNFTKKVFYNQAWDDVVIKARGLFYDVDSHEIVARGYEKFFNVGEREDTKLEALKETLVFPLTLYVKENGFLGNIGYDRRSDSLFVASKSTPDGDFAAIFREILNDTLNEGQQEALRRFLRDNEASATFEVIDPIRDAHMIEYDRPKIVLLDILHRTMDFEKASYDVLTEVGNRFGLEVKTKGAHFKDWKSFEGWYRKAMNGLDYKFQNNNVEGFVIEDAKGFMTKIKLPYYAFWKQMRGMKERILHAREKGEVFDGSHTKKPDGTPPDAAEIELAHSFRDWCLDQPDDVLKGSIIALRNAFDARPELSLSPAM